VTDAELERYARHIVLRDVGGLGQQKLKAARVAVVGVGGIGCPALQYLAAAGVGHLTLIDDDKVERSNLQRQILFGDADIGVAKVVAGAQRLQHLNPRVDIETVAVRLDEGNARTHLAGHDVVLDGTDSFAARLAVADAAHDLRIPLVSAALGSFEGQLAVYRGWEPVLPCYRCLVGDASDRVGDSCADQGILGAMAGVVGSLAALEVLRAIVGFGEDLAGKLLLIDGLSLRMRSVRVTEDPGCRCAG